MKAALSVLIRGIVLLACSSACADVRLPNGFNIVETQPGENVVVHGAELVVFGNVERFGVSGDVVIGFVTKPPPPKEEQDYYNDVRVGYFILDTESGMRALGLDEFSWRVLLERIGINTVPHMHPICGKTSPRRAQ